MRKEERLGFALYLQCFGEIEHSGISRATVRSLFPVVERESETDYWQVRYDQKNFCKIGVTPTAPHGEMLKALYVDRPCGDLRLWDAILSVLHMGTVVIFWPGGPPVVANASLAAKLPKDMTDAIGQPVSVSSAQELLRLVRES